LWDDIGRILCGWLCKWVKGLKDLRIEGFKDFE
jgi:hypothetical protein